MSLSSGDIKFFKSTSSNLGGAITATELNGSLNDMFDNVSSSEALAGSTEYRCFYVKNNHNTDTLYSPKLYQSNTGTTGVTYEIGWGSAAISGSEQFVASETTAPTGITFATCDGVGNAAALGSNLLAGQWKAIWVKRIVAASTPAATLASITVSVIGDTVA